MKTPYHFKIPDFQSNIPLLDREFDLKSPEIEDFILSHVQAKNEDL